MTADKYHMNIAERTARNKARATASEPEEVSLNICGQARRGSVRHFSIDGRVIDKIINLEGFRFAVLCGNSSAREQVKAFEDQIPYGEAI